MVIWHSFVQRIPFSFYSLKMKEYTRLICNWTCLKSNLVFQGRSGKPYNRFFVCVKGSWLIYNIILWYHLMNISQLHFSTGLTIEFLWKKWRQIGLHVLIAKLDSRWFASQPTLWLNTSMFFLPSFKKKNVKTPYLFLFFWHIAFGHFNLTSFTD